MQACIHVCVPGAGRVYVCMCKYGWSCHCQRGMALYLQRPWEGISSASCLGCKQTHGSRPGEWVLPRALPTAQFRLDQVCKRPSLLHGLQAQLKTETRGQVRGWSGAELRACRVPQRPFIEGAAKTGPGAKGLPPHELASAAGAVLTRPVYPLPGSWSAPGLLTALHYSRAMLQALSTAVRSNVAGDSGLWGGHRARH